MIFFRIICYGLVLTIGWWIAQSSWNKKTFIYVNHRSNNLSRNIASLKTNHAISNSLVFKNGIASTKNQQALTKASEIALKKDFIQIALTKFILLDSNGEQNLLCHDYQTIDLFFIAHQESVHGHTPQMILKTKCQASKRNSQYMEPFIIPRKKIIQSPVTQQLFHSDLDSSKNKTIILFNHLGLFWPKEWILTQIRLSNSQTKKDFIIHFASKQEKDYLLVHLL